MYSKKVVNEIRKLLLKRRQTLSVGESVTSGHLQAALSLADKAMEFFQGGITAYNIGQKSRHLSIDPIHAVTCNCVSEITAEQMALGVCRLFSSDWGISITGYAAVVPELNVKKLFAFSAVAFRGEIVASTKFTIPNQSQLEAQVLYAQEALKYVLLQIRKR